jgi:hypothetical protein
VAWVASIDPGGPPPGSQPGPALSPEVAVTLRSFWMLSWAIESFRVNGYATKSGDRRDYESVYLRRSFGDGGNVRHETLAAAPRTNKTNVPRGLPMRPSSRS